MKRRVLLVLSILLIIVGTFILIRLATAALSPRGKGALQVTTNVKAAVFLDNKRVGATPLCLCEQNQTISEGTHDLKIVPEDNSMQSYTAKIDINPGVLTAVERTFLPGSLSSSYILTLEKVTTPEAQVFVASIPDQALISIDGQSEGVTPYTQDLTASEHEVEIEKPGFSKKTVRVRAVKSYKLILNVILGAQSEGIDTDSPTASPTPTTSPTTAPKNSVTIKQTPTGFLRVRETPSTAATEVGRVLPDEIYEFVDENASWYQIKLKDGTSGWISKTYAQKSTE